MTETQVPHDHDPRESASRLCRLQRQALLKAIASPDGGNTPCSHAVLPIQQLEEISSALETATIALESAAGIGLEMRMGTALWAQRPRIGHLLADVRALKVAWRAEAQISTRREQFEEADVFEDCAAALQILLLRHEPVERYS